jgi:hypothetical protein
MKERKRNERKEREERKKGKERKEFLSACMQNCELLFSPNSSFSLSFAASEIKKESWTTAGVVVGYLCVSLCGVVNAHNDEKKIELFCTYTARVGAVELLKQLLQTALVTTRHVRMYVCCINGTRALALMSLSFERGNPLASLSSFSLSLSFVCSAKDLRWSKRPLRWLPMAVLAVTSRLLL